MSETFLKIKWWQHLWLKRGQALVLLILLNLLMTAVLGYFTPILIAGFYQHLTSSSFENQMWWLIALLLAEYFNRFIFQLATHRYIQLLLGETRRRSYSLWLKAPFRQGKKEDYPMGEVLARLMNDTDAVREIVTSGSFGIFIDIIFILSCLISFLKLNSTTGVGLFLIEILICFLLIQGSKAMGAIFMEVRKVTGKMARIVADITSGLKQLFYTPHRHYAQARGEAIFEDFLQKQLKANLWDAGYYSAAESLYPILVAMVMLMVPIAGVVEVAVLAVLVDLVQKSISPIKEIASKISVLQRAASGIERLTEFNQSFAHAEKFPPQKNLLVPELDFELQYFAFGEGFSLRDIRFKLSQGNVLGILGESGCGKSTLLRLLSGQYDTFKGRISVGDKIFDPESPADLSHFSSLVSLVSQDSHVFSESLIFNLGLGETQDFASFWEKAQAAIPYLGRWGIRPENLIRAQDLSMGQKQLLSGLRALYLKKPIILMDEISSGLDSELEAALRDLTHFVQKSSLTIVVTHRLETILGAEQLLLLEKGRPVALGSHAQIAEHPKYLHFLEHL